MIILITGGTGFLGKHVMRKFQEKCNFTNNFTVAPSSKHLDLTNRKATENYIETLKPDVILHMAALCGGILANKNSPADFLHKNIDMASNLYHVAHKIGCNKIYSLGSVCGYPKFCPIPFKEDNLWNGYPEETNAPYGIAKKVLLMLHQTYREQYGFKGAHLIPVNLYGEHDHFDLVNSHVIPALINKFTNSVKNGDPYVECWGSGEATREFLYAGDAADAISEAVLTGFDSDLPINLGTGKEISIKELAELIKELTGYTGEIVFNGTVSDGQPKRMLDVSRAKELLNWTANTSLREGILKTITWYLDSHDDA
jgi:GDP-L-fucose synthase